MPKISQRQSIILDCIQRQGPVANKDIVEYLNKKIDQVSRVTVVRDLDILQKQDLVVREGRGRGLKYREAIANRLLTYIDVDEYFKLGPDERKLLFESFNFKIFKDLFDIFTKEKSSQLKKLNNDYRQRVSRLSATALKKEFERLTIELSWKSSRLEGNTYSLIDTEILIKDHREAKGHNKEEAVMILNHKKALDYILENKTDFKKINLRKIENIHQLLIADLGIPSGLRKRAVGIVGTKYKPLDNQYQIGEAMNKTVSIINSINDPFLKAFIAILMISYIQPFEDGNKRTGRLLGNALLLANNICPLSFRSVDESDYKKAVILFYEQNNARFFKELFIQQYKFACHNYFS